MKSIWQKEQVNELQVIISKEEEEGEGKEEEVKRSRTSSNWSYVTSKLSELFARVFHQINFFLLIQFPRPQKRIIFSLHYTLKISALLICYAFSIYLFTVYLLGLISSFHLNCQH